MTIGYLAVKSISRSAGRSATAATAYRCAVDVVDERTGELHSYARRSRVDHVEVIGFDGSPAELANAMELAERRKDSKVARDVVLALPADASPLVRRAMAAAWAQWVCDRHGCAAIVAVHAPGRGGDRRNWHAHVLLTTRRCDGAALGAKLRELDQAQTSGDHIEAWRTTWGQIVGIDMRSYERQGIEREAEPKLPRLADREAYRVARAADPAALRSEAGALQRQIDAAERRSVPVRPRARPLATTPGRHPLPMGLRLDQIAHERCAVPLPAPAPAAPAAAPAVPWATRLSEWRANRNPSPTLPSRAPSGPPDRERNRGSAVGHVPPAAERAGPRSEPDWPDPGPSGMG